MPPIFGRAAITLAIGPHSSCEFGGQYECCRFPENDSSPNWSVVCRVVK